MIWRRDQASRGGFASALADGPALRDRSAARLLDAPGGEKHGDPRADALAAVDGERAAMQLDQRLGERQAETGPALAARIGVVDLAEGLHRPRQPVGVQS